MARGVGDEYDEEEYSKKGSSMMSTPETRDVPGSTHGPGAPPPQTKPPAPRPPKE